MDTQDAVRLSSWNRPVESLNACPICGSPDRTLAFSDLRDTVFGIAPGSWRMHRCQSCATYYLDPRPTRESVIFAYENYFTHEVPAHDSLASPRTLAHRLRNDYLTSKFGYALPGASGLGRLVLQALPFRRKRADRLVRGLAAPKPGARLLDIGCGNGEFLANMRDIGWDVTGHDLDPEAAAATRRRGIHTVEGPLDSAPFDGRFNVITMSHVIEHVHDPAGILKTCHRLLLPNGMLWLATPNADSIGLRRFRGLWLGLDSPRHLCVFSVKALSLALERAGFRQATVRAEMGAYGSIATSAAVHRKVKRGLETSRLHAHAYNLMGDVFMSLFAGTGEELIAVARA